MLEEICSNVQKKVQIFPLTLPGTLARIAVRLPASVPGSYGVTAWLYSPTGRIYSRGSSELDRRALCLHLAERSGRILICLHSRISCLIIWLDQIVWRIEQPDDVAGALIEFLPYRSGCVSHQSQEHFLALWYSGKCQWHSL